MAQQVRDEYDKDYRDGLLLFNGDEKKATEYANGIIVDRGQAAAVGLGALFTAPLLPKSAIIGGVVSGGMNAGVQYVTTGDVNTNDVMIWTSVGVITCGYGTGLLGTTGWGIVGGSTSSYLKDENPVVGGLIGGASSFIGYGTGKYIKGIFQNKFNPVADKYLYESTNGFTGFTGHFIESSVPANVGSFFSSASSEGTNYLIDQMRKNKNENKDE